LNSNKFHIAFKLNGKSFFSSDEIIAYSKEISVSTNQFLSDWFSEEDFIQVQTSGSTGKPKSIQLKKEFMKNSAKMTGEFFNLQENTTALLCLSTDYIAGKMMLVRALILGWNLDVVEPNSNPLKKNKKKYDFSAFVPLQLENSLENINQIKTIIVGGGKVSNSLQTKILSSTTAIFATYGMTETVTHVAIKKLNQFSSLQLGTMKRSHFQILPNVTILKDNRNCLVINAPKLSVETIITKDIVELISETEFELLGRIDNVINSGGIKLHPEKIEDKLSAIISTRFFVAGILDEILGKKLILVVERQSSKTSKFQSLLREKINNLETLSKFQKPKEIYFIPEFIETKTGKIQRKKNLELL